jgi:urease accessory protein
MLLKTGSRVVVALTGMIITPLALAHTVTSPTLGLIPGVVHPLTGVDHVLAAMAAGIWGGVSTVRHGRSVIAVFLGMLALGAIAGFAGASMPLVEPVIALSVVVFGALIASRAEWSGLVAGAIAGGFAFFHGFAHAAGLPPTAGAGWYLLGLLLATAFMLGAGLVFGRRLVASGSQFPLQLAGVFFALSGSLLLAYP